MAVAHSDQAASAGARTGRALPQLTFALLIACVFTFSTLLHARTGARTGAPGGPPSAAQRLTGGARKVWCAHCWEMADLYFHRGVGHMHEDTLADSWYGRLGARLRPHGHLHATGSDVREIMPWLRLAAQADPHDIPVLLTAAFWLARDAGRPDLAAALLREARADNPFNDRISFELARIDLHAGRLAEARRELDAAIVFWPGGRDAGSPTARDDLARMLTYRAVLHEVDGEMDAARRALRAALSLHPEWNDIRARLEELDSGQETAEQSAAYLKRLLHLEDNGRMIPGHADAHASWGGGTACGEEDECGHHHHAEHEAECHHVP